MSGHCVKCGQPLRIESDSETCEAGDDLCEVCRDAMIGDRSVNSGSLKTKSYNPPPSPDARVAQFDLVRILGRGSFGNVWLADDSRLGRAVALKLPNANRAGASTLFHEAKTAASLRHPNIVTVYEVGEERGQVYIASEFIDGVTLRDFLSAKRPKMDRMIELLIPISEALQFAHEHGVVHRDVKPANILVNQAGKPYVTDFGLAKRLTADETISSHGQILGTARYMSPEQAVGKTEDTDARSDIYSVGVMMFEMLTGESPFRGNARAILQQKIMSDAPSPRLLEPSVPRDAETICLKCLEREPNKRFDSATELTNELKRFANGEPIQSRPIGRVERGWRWCKRRPAISSLMLALFLSLTTGLVGVSYYWRQSVNNAYVAKQKLYRSWMNLAANHVDGGNSAGVRDLLTRISADPELAGMRGFEFNYFTSLADQISPIGSVGSSVVDVAITYDGNTGAATSGGREIAIWDTGSRQLLRVLIADQDGFTAIDFSAASSRLVAGSIDGFLRFYEPLASDKVIRKLQHGPPVRFVAFSPNGRHVIASGKKGAVRMWDANSGKRVAEVPTGKGETRAIRFSPDSSRLYVARDDGRIRQWSIPDLIETGLETVPMPQTEFNTAPNPVAMSVSDRGDQLVVTFYDGSMMVRDLSGNTPASPTTMYKTHWGLIQDIEYLSGSSIVAFTTSVGNLYSLDTDSGHEVRSVSTHAATGRLARSGNRKVLLLGSGDGTVSKLDLQSLAKPFVHWGQAPVRSIAFVEPEKLLAAYENGDLALWDLATGKRISVDSDLLKPTMLIAMNSARRFVATAGSRSGIEIRDSSSLKSVAELSTAEAGVSAMRFSKSGDLFAVAVRQGPVRVYTVGDWEQPRFEVTLDRELVRSIAVSRDNQFVAVARGGHVVDLLDSRNGKLVNTIALGHDEPSVLEFCQDGVTLAVGTSAGAILFYDIPSRKLRISSKAHTGRINALAVLPGSQMIVSAGRDKQLNLWDLDSGDLVTQLHGHHRQVFTIATSADGKTIVSGGLEGDVRIWQGESQD